MTDDTDNINDVREYEYDPRMIFSLFTGDKYKYFQGREAIKRLKEECDVLAKGTFIGVVISSCTSLLSLVTVPATFVGLAGATVTLEYLIRVRRLCSVAEMLLDGFNDEIIVTLRVKTNSSVIDILARMPDKRIFALMVRSNQDISVKWNQERQQFYITKKGKNPKKCDSLTKTIDELNTLTDLRQERHPLMGNSYAERNAPIIKAIVLAKEAHIASSNSPDQWTDFGLAKVLKIRTTSVTYVVEYDNLVNFMSLPKKSS